jgi:hypothetical protein
MTLSSLLKTLGGFVLRVLLAFAGLVFLLSLLTAALLLLALWGLRALWYRLSGRPVPPLAITILRPAQWRRFHPAGARPAGGADVIDVESRTVNPVADPPRR